MNGGRVCSVRVVRAYASPKTVAWPKTVRRSKKQVAERYSKEITVGFEFFDVERRNQSRRLINYIATDSSPNKYPGGAIERHVQQNIC